MSADCRKKIYLFGSFAEGRETENSVFDFYIVVADGTDNLVDLTAEAYKSIQHVRSRAVDIIVGTESSSEGRKFKMVLEGVANHLFVHITQNIVNHLLPLPAGGGKSCKSIDCHVWLKEKE